MELADRNKEGTISCFAQTFGPAAPGIIPRRRDAQHMAHEANRKCFALILNETEFHFGASEKMRSVFFKSPRSMRGPSFSRGKGAFWAAKSAAGGIAACVLGRRGDPAWPPPV